MNGEARQHHYIPQCYLRGFTRLRGKKQLISVVDLERKVQYSTNPRNIAGERDFNRISVEGLPPDVLETEWSKFETRLDQALKDFEKNPVLTGTSFEVVLNLVALLATRNPQLRDSWANFQERVTRKQLQMLVSTEDRWRSVVERMRADGEDIGPVTYEQMREFVQGDRFEVRISTENHLSMEFAAIDPVLDSLSHRKWTLLESSKDTGPFVTCDRPVAIAWKRPEEIPPFFRSSPGFGVAGTEVIFSVSQKFALVGDFDVAVDHVVPCTRQIVAGVNGNIMNWARNQVYTPGIDFCYRDADGAVHMGGDLLRK